MHRRIALIFFLVPPALAACVDTTTPPSHRLSSVQVNLTPSEKNAIDAIVKDLPPDEAARMRERLGRTDVIVWGKDDEMHEKIEAFYDARAARLRAETTKKGFVPPPRNAENSWVPGKEESLFINTFLNRLPASDRARAREILLRTDARIFPREGDAEGKAILDKIYELRGERIRQLRESRFK